MRVTRIDLVLWGGVLLFASYGFVAYSMEAAVVLGEFGFILLVLWAVTLPRGGGRHPPTGFS